MDALSGAGNKGVQDPLLTTKNEINTKIVEVARVLNTGRGDPLNADHMIRIVSELGEDFKGKLDELNALLDKVLQKPTEEEVKEVSTAFSSIEVIHRLKDLTPMDVKFKILRVMAHANPKEVLKDFDWIKSILGYHVYELLTPLVFEGKLPFNALDDSQQEGVFNFLTGLQKGADPLDPSYRMTKVYLNDHNMKVYDWLLILPKSTSHIKISTSKLTEFELPRIDLPELKTVEFSDCPSLVRANLGNVTEPTKFIFDRCPSLKSISGKMRALDCSGCKALESLPQNLQELKCCGCYLREIPNLPALKKLDCFDNPILVVLPPRFDKLEHLVLSGCPLVWRIPEAPKLKTLLIAGCREVAQIPASCTELEELWARKSGLTSIPSTLLKLKKLDINECDIPTIPNTLTNLRHLNFTSLEEIPDTLVHLTSLNITHSALVTIPNTLKALQSLSLFYCRNFEAIPNTLVHLNALWIGNCPLKTIPDELIELRNLRIEDCPIEAIPKGFIELTDLKIKNCPVQTIPEELTKLKNLTINANINIPDNPNLNVIREY